MTAGALFGVALAPLCVSVLSGLLGGPATLGHALALVCCVSIILAAAIFSWAGRFFPRKDAS
jgi:hypothetical protein